jgi:hypothetical protein
MSNFRYNYISFYYYSKISIEVSTPVNAAVAPPIIYTAITIPASAVAASATISSTTFAATSS